MVIFIMTYWVVRKFFLGPINDVLETREHETKTAEQRYEEAMARFSEATAQVEERLHVAKKDASQMRDKFRAEASAQRATLVERTSAEAKKLVTEAETKLNAEIKEVRETLGRDAESLAHLAAERLLGRSV